MSWEGISGRLSLPISTCSAAKCANVLYFQMDLGWPDRPGGQIGQWIGTLVHGEDLEYCAALEYIILE